MFKGEHYLLGRYKNMKDAIAARKQAENDHFGKYRKSKIILFDNLNQFYK